MVHQKHPKTVLDLKKLNSEHDYQMFAVYNVCTLWFSPVY